MTQPQPLPSILGKHLMQPRDQRGFAVRPISYYSQWRPQPDKIINAVHLYKENTTIILHYKDKRVSVQGKWELVDNSAYYHASIELVSSQPIDWKNLVNMENLPYYGYFMTVEVVTDCIAVVSFQHDSVNEWWYEDMIGFWHGTCLLGPRLLYHTHRMVWTTTASITSMIDLIRRFCLLDKAVGNRSVFPLYLYNIPSRKVKVAGNGICPEEER